MLVEIIIDGIFIYSYTNYAWFCLPNHTSCTLYTCKFDVVSITLREFNHDDNCPNAALNGIIMCRWLVFSDCRQIKINDDQNMSALSTIVQK